MHKFTLRDLFRVLTNVCLAMGFTAGVQNAPRGGFNEVDVQEVLLIGLMFANFFLLFVHRLLIPRWNIECYSFGWVSFLLGGANSGDMGRGHMYLGLGVSLTALLFLVLCFLHSRRLKKEAAWSEKLAGMVNPFEEHEPELDSASEPLFGEIGEVGNLSSAEIVEKTRFFPSSR